MISGVSASSVSSGQSSNALANSPITGSPAANPATPVKDGVKDGPAGGFGGLGLFDALTLSDGLPNQLFPGNWLSGTISEIGQFTTQFEDYLFGNRAESSAKQSVLSLFALPSDWLAITGDAGNITNSAIAGSMDSLANGKFRSLFPYADLGNLNVESERSSSRSSVLELFGLSSRDTLNDGSRAPIDRALSHSTPSIQPPSNPLFFRHAQAEQTRLRHGSESARLIPWEERRKREGENKRGSLLGRAWGKIEDGLIRFVKGINDTLTK